MQTRIRAALALTLLLAGCASASIAEQKTEAAEARREAAQDAAKDAAREAAAQEADKEAEKAAIKEEAQEAREEARAEKEEVREDAREAAADDRKAAKKAISGLDDDDIIARGKASYYHLRFNGRRTASGQRYDNDAMTAAHRTLPFGTEVRVTNVRNGRSVVVKVNDRGPFRKSRIIDVSGAAARALGLLHHGVGEVILSKP